MAGTKGIRAGRAYVELYADRSKLVRGLRMAGAKIAAFGKAAAVGIAGVGAAGAAVAAPFALAAKSFAKFGDEMGKASTRTGVSVEALSGLKHAAEQGGASFGALENGLRRMQKGIGDAAQGTGEAVDALNTLGLSAADLMGLSPDEQFKTIADRVAGIADPTMRAAAAMDIFGKSGTSLIPMMSQGAAGIEAMQQEAADLGLILSTEDAKAAEGFTDALSRMSKVGKMAINHLGAAVVGGSGGLVDGITAKLAQISAKIREYRPVIVATMQSIGAGIKAVWKAIAPVVVPVVQGLAKAIAAVWGWLNETVIPIVADLAGGIVDAFKKVWAVVSPYVEGTVQFITKAWGKVVEVLGPVWAWLKKAALNAFAGVTFAVKNVKNIVAYSLVKAAHSIVKFGSQLKHTFTEVIPAYLGWFKDHWREVLTDTWNLTKSIFSNMWTNIKNVVKAIAGVLKGEKWDFEWTDLTKGFKSVISELPEIADREIGALESALKAEGDALGAAIAGGWDAHIAAMNEQLNSLGDDAKPNTTIDLDTKQTFDPRKLAQDMQDMAVDATSGLQEKAMSVTGTFNAAAIQGLGSGDGKMDKMVTAAEDTAKTNRQMLKEARNGGMAFA